MDVLRGDEAKTILILICFVKCDVVWASLSEQFIFLHFHKSFSYFE